MIKAIIFDFGRVISAQKPAWLFRLYEEDLGLERDAINSIMFESRAWNDALLGRKSSEEFWHEIGPKLGLLRPDAIDAFRRRYHGDEAINDDVVALMRRLHSRYKLAVLSNSPPGLEDWLVEWGIRDMFDVVFCSGDEGVSKPDPAAFQMTLERLRVAPQEAVFIDDTIEHVLVARKLGLHGIIFTTAEALADELAEILARQPDGVRRRDGALVRF